MTSCCCTTHARACCSRLLVLPAPLRLLRLRWGRWVAAACCSAAACSDWRVACREAHSLVGLRL
jgi:hypothetical protein